VDGKRRTSNDERRTETANDERRTTNDRRFRIAWFSPLPPARSGIAAYSAELVPRLAPAHAIDCFSNETAGDFLWKAHRDPYNLVVYQLGNAPCHDFMWGYMAACPGLVVLHDARLHQARAHDLLEQERFDDYRQEFWYDHPQARRDFVEYAVAGLGGPIYYCWPMLRVVMRTARCVAVHNARVAADLREEFPEVPVEAIHLGTVPFESADNAAGRARVRARFGVPENAVLFAAFGKMTAEKRIEVILRAFETMAGERGDVHLLLAGDTSECAAIDAGRFSPALSARVHVAGYIPDQAIGEYLAASDACLCLRWPTALETSAAWVQCLAAGKPTVISDLAHLVDIPAIDPSGRRAPPASAEPIAIAVDLLDEDGSLLLALRTLAGDPLLRDALGRAGHAYWEVNHAIDVMVRDYEQLIERAAASPVPTVADLPPHFTDDHSALARAITGQFGFSLDDILGSST
jgi:glycosyltransferase involved in cell wall biosynthesis